MSALDAVSKNEQTRSSGSDSVPCCLSFGETPEEIRLRKRREYYQRNKDKIYASKVKSRKKHWGKTLEYGRKLYSEKKDDSEWMAYRNKQQSESVKLRYAKDVNVREDRKRRSRKIGKASRANLTDGYIKDQLSKKAELKTSDIPQELVELKRMQLKTHRKLKEIENEK